MYSHIHTILTAFELPRSIIHGPFGLIQPISSIHGDKLEVSKSENVLACGGLELGTYSTVDQCLDHYTTKTYLDFVPTLVLLRP